MYRSDRGNVLTTLSTNACHRMSVALSVHLSRWFFSSRSENDHKSAHIGQLCMGASPDNVIDSFVDIEFPLQSFRVVPAFQRFDEWPFRAENVERQPLQLVQRAPQSTHVRLPARHRFVLRGNVQRHYRPRTQYNDRQAAVNDVESTAGIRWSDERRARGRKCAFDVERRHRERCWRFQGVVSEKMSGRRETRGVGRWIRLKYDIETWKKAELHVCMHVSLAPPPPKTRSKVVCKTERDADRRSSDIRISQR
jgi:hypothetical protein